jgi:hypothetical protein
VRHRATRSRPFTTLLLLARIERRFRAPEAVIGRAYASLIRKVCVAVL